MNHVKEEGTKQLYMDSVVCEHLRAINTIKKLSKSGQSSLRNLYNRRLNGLPSHNCAIELKQKGVAHFINNTWVVAFWAIPYQTYELDRKGLAFSLTLVTNPEGSRNTNGKKANRYRTDLTDEILPELDEPSKPTTSGSNTLHLAK